MPIYAGPADMTSFTQLLLMAACGATSGPGGDSTGDTADSGEPNDWVPGELEVSEVRVEAGSFTMGCTDGQRETCTDEYPTHDVTITRDFMVTVTEITQGQWSGATGTNPSYHDFCGESCPVEKVSWMDAARFANLASEIHGLEACYLFNGEDVAWPAGLDCQGFRLPTEAEWEYAARAGRDTMFSGSNVIDVVAWYGGNAGEYPRDVATLAPNQWGLYDMTGNVAEWVWDWFHDYTSSAVADPIGQAKGDLRVHRGGMFQSSLDGANLSERGRVKPTSAGLSLGLRLVRTADAGQQR